MWGEDQHLVMASQLLGVTSFPRAIGYVVARSCFYGRFNQCPDGFKFLQAASALLAGFGVNVQTAVYG